MKILLLGKNGMLGSAFEKMLEDFGENFEVLAFDKDGLDITDKEALSEKIESFSPDTVINCTGYTAVDNAETNKGDAFLLNADAVSFIAELCEKYGSILIHFSTDYVFDGSKDVSEGGYDENSTPNPLNVYGESKFEGEKFIKSKMSRYFIIRTSWLYGPQARGGNFVDTMLRLGNEVVTGKRDSLRVVNDQFGSPTYTYDLVRAVIDEFLMRPPEETPDFGVYHLTGSGSCSWHEFAVKIFELAEIKINVEKIPTSEYKTSAKRPCNSILLNTKLPEMRKWEDSLKDYLSNLGFTNFLFGVKFSP